MRWQELHAPLPAAKFFSPSVARPFEEMSAGRVSSLRRRTSSSLASSRNAGRIIPLQHYFKDRSGEVNQIILWFKSEQEKSTKKLLAILGRITKLGGI